MALRYQDVDMSTHS